MVVRRQRFATPEVFAELHLPAPNQFIPTSIALVRERPSTSTPPGPPGTPTRLVATATTTLWFKADDTFYVPRGVVSVLVIKYVVQGPGVHHRPARLTTTVRRCVGRGVAMADGTRRRDPTARWRRLRRPPSRS